MRILLAHNSTYYPAHGGGDKSNRLLIEALAERGHQCRVVARLAAFGIAEHNQFLADLKQRSVAIESSQNGIVVFTLNGVEVHVATHNAGLRAFFSSVVDTFRPDVILCSTDDPAQLLLTVALQSSAKVVYFSRATLALPFGPDSAFPGEEKTNTLRRVNGMVGVSEYVARYIREWSGIPAVALPISLLGPGPFPELGRFENEFVTMVNPCRVKGISIFTGMARLFPHNRFAAIPMWGTNEDDLAELRAHPNITILDPVDNIDLFLARTRILLVPSLWAEARSRIVVEAMLRGVPVIASDIGGIPEAKMGVDYLIPVRPIEHYEERVDNNMVPIARVPPQDLAPWREALAQLLTDRSHYDEVARASREAALAYAERNTVAAFESYLEQFVRKQTIRSQDLPKSTPVQRSLPASALDKLSPEKRALLALRLRKQAPHITKASKPYFPINQSDTCGHVRLFCFPYAGGGTAVFRNWPTKLADLAALYPARLPGRESRSTEQPFDDLIQLVAALADAILPLLDRPFAFFGHSMGAAIAFELARLLRRTNRAQPLALFVSGARAPQFRLNHRPGPAPSDSELIEQLRRLEGTPPELLASPALLHVLAPSLRADTAAYRNYVYLPDTPLACPIFAYGGANDSNITRDHLEAWHEQTTAAFKLQLFPGGHFFVRTAEEEFLEALARDLAGVLKEGAD